MGEVRHRKMLQGFAQRGHDNARPKDRNSGEQQLAPGYKQCALDSGLASETHHGRRPAQRLPRESQHNRPQRTNTVAFGLCKRRSCGHEDSTEARSKVTSMG